MSCITSSGIVMIDTIAINKGGTGKSTTVQNFAVILSAFGKKVLVIDLDIQGNCTDGLGINKWNLKRTSIDAMINGDLSDAIVRSKYGCHVIGCNIDSHEQVAILNQRLVDRDKQLSVLTNKLKKRFDVILIDTPPTFDVCLLNAVECCDRVIVPIQIEPYAVEGLNRIAGLCKSFDKSVTTFGTMLNPRLILSRELKKCVEEKFDSSMLSVTVPRSIKVPEAQWSQIPIVVKLPKNPVSRAYLKLVEVIYHVS